MPIKHLVDCVLNPSDLSSVYAHHDNITYHVAIGCRGLLDKARVRLDHDDIEGRQGGPIVGVSSQRHVGARRLLGCDAAALE